VVTAFGSLAGVVRFAAGRPLAGLAAGAFVAALVARAIRGVVLGALAADACVFAM
jgi:hypothetical protein